MLNWTRPCLPCSRANQDSQLKTVQLQLYRNLDKGKETKTFNHIIFSNRKRSQCSARAQQLTFYEIIRSLALASDTVVSQSRDPILLSYAPPSIDDQLDIKHFVLSLSTTAGNTPVPQLVPAVQH